MQQTDKELAFVLSLYSKFFDLNTVKSLLLCTKRLKKTAQLSLINLALVPISNAYKFTEQEQKIITRIKYRSDSTNMFTGTHLSLKPFKNLVELIFGFNIDFPIKKDYLPIGLTKLELGCHTFSFLNFKPGILPPTLKSLNMLYVNLINPLQKDVLPAGLIELKISYDYPLTIGVLPEGLKYLKLKDYDNQLNDGVLPSSLLCLKMNKFNCMIHINVLPLGLLELHMKKFTASFDIDVLPKTLRVLRVQTLMSYWTDYPLPDNIKLLILQENIGAYIPPECEIIYK